MARIQRGALCAKGRLRSLNESTKEAAQELSVPSLQCLACGVVVVVRSTQGTTALVWVCCTLAPLAVVGRRAEDPPLAGVGARSQMKKIFLTLP